MKDQNKTKKQLIEELTDLRERISECENIESERRQAEEMHRESEARYRSMFEHSLDAILLTAPDGQILAANPEACSILGYTEAELQQIGRAGVVYPVDPRLPPALEERVRTGKFKGELTFVRRDGSKLEVEISSAIFRDKNGFERTSTLFRDITVRKRMEERLREYEKVVENSQDMIVVVDKNYKYVVANAQFLKQRGLEKDQVVGRSVQDLLGEDYFEWEVKKNLDASFRGEVVRFETKLLYPELGERNLLVQYFPLRNHEGINEIVSIIQDITEPKQRENEILTQRALAMDLGAATDLNEALKLCTETAINLSGMDCGGIYLVDEKSGDLDLKFSVGLSDEFIHEVKHYDKESRNARLVMEGKPIFNHYPTFAEPITDNKLRERLGSLAVIPILHEKKVIACLNVASHESLKVPGFARDSLKSIAAQVGSSIMRIMAEEKIKQLTQFLEAVIDNANIWVDVLDENANVVIWNKAAESISGYSSQEVIGHDRIWERLYPGENNHKKLKNRVLQLMQRGLEDREIETTIRTKAGEKKTISWFSRNLVDNKGTPIGSVVLGQDITERKRTEEALREMNQHLQALIQASPLAIVSQDYHKNVLEWNPAAERIFGWREEEVLGKPIPIVPEDKKEEFRNIFEKVLKGNTVRGIETHRQTKDGVWVDVSLSSATLYDSDGKPKGNVTLLEDITKRKKTEEERLKLIEQLRTGRERLQELSRRLVDLQETERREIARELHDEVGQNLTTLSINLSMIQNLTPGESASKAADRINDSQRLVEETVVCIRDVMARLRPPVLDDFGLIAALNWYSGQFKKRYGIPTVFILKGEELTPRLPLVTETAMFRIAQEALNNAAKHAEADQITLVLENRDESVLLVVDDNGRGFDPVAHHQIGAKPEWGLINMRERALSIGGQFRIESTPGKGTKVIVEVPRKR